MNARFLLLPAVMTLPLSAIAETDSLSKALAAKNKELRAQIPEEGLKTIDAGVKKVAEAKVTEGAVAKGDKAPDFTLKDAKGDEVTLSKLLSDGPVVLTWYRGGWCPYCNLHLQAYQESLPAFQEAGAKLVAVTPELPDNSLSTSEKSGLKFAVLSDSGNKVAKQYGLIFKLTPEVKDLYNNGFGIDLAKSNGPEAADDELPLAATYVIGKDGKVAYSFLDADYTKRAEPSVIVEELGKLDE